MQRGSRPDFRRCSCSALLLLGVLVSTSSALALGDGDKEAVRALSNDAAADFNAGRFAAARDKFLRAFEVARVPRLAVWLARSHERLGRLVTAYEYYRQALRLERNDLWVGDVQQQAQHDAERELSALMPRLPKLKVEARGASAADTRVKIDDSEVPVALLGVERFVDPGQHEIVGSVKDQVVRKTVQLDEGAEATVQLDFESAQSTNVAPQVSSRPSAIAVPIEAKPQVSSAGSSQRTWGWVAIGVGTAGTLTGLGFGAVVASKHDSLSRDCSNGVCSGQYESRVESYRTVRTISTIGFVVGGVGLGAGLTLILLSPKSTTAQSRVGFWAAPQMVGINGTF